MTIKMMIRAFGLVILKFLVRFPYKSLKKDIPIKNVLRFYLKSVSLTRAR
jgi:hypothetical protein